MLRRTRTVTALAIAGAALGAGTGSASAATSTVGGPCPQQAYTTAFSSLGDTSLYAFAPGGAFEAALTGWTLTGGPSLVADRVDNFGKGGDVQSLSLPAGASATTPAMCLSTDYPYLRFFAKSSSSSITSTLRVDVIYDGTSPATVIPVGLLTGNAMTAWKASPKLSTGVYLATLIANVKLLKGILAGTSTAVSAGNASIRLTATGGAWQVDDLMVDPRMR